jgi:paraquat-inducible protein B
VIGAFALGFLALLSFGGFSFFSKPQRFLVFFNESVHGLDLGSAVKLRGVRVGRVVDLTLRYDEASRRSMVAVVCEFNKDALSGAGGTGLSVASREDLQGLVDRGLRAQLGVGGLATGLLFVELDFFNAAENPVDKNLTDSRYVVVPAVTSTISESIASAAEILGKLKTIDYAGISRGLTALINDVRQQLSGLDLKGVAAQWRQTGAQLEAQVAANGPEVKRTLEQLNAAVADLRGAVTKLDAQIEPRGRELGATLAEARKAIGAFSETAAAAKGFIAAQSGVGEELAVTLARLNEAAESVRQLADFIERNPSALLSGKKPPQ